MTSETTTALVTGAAGLLGTWLRRTAPPEVNVVPVTHRRRLSGAEVVADLRDREVVAAAFRTVRPHLVIHAGFARDEASIVGATRNVVDMAHAVEADLIFVSTESVFSGDGAPRAETARPDPMWDYGRWKAAAERTVSARDERAAIVRLPLIVSVDPEDHIITSIRSGHRTGDPTVWFTDEIRQPAYAAELARAIWAIAALPPDLRAGPWHLPGPERLSRHEIAERAVSTLGLDRASVVAAPTPSDAHRPRDLNLTGERAKEHIGWAPSAIHTSMPATTPNSSAPL